MRFHDLRHTFTSLTLLRGAKPKVISEALAKVETLSGLLPMCAWCKSIRNDKGYWQTVEQYIGEHSKVEFTHGICLDCVKKEFPETCEKEGNASSISSIAVDK